MAGLRGKGVWLERGDGDNCPGWSGGQGQRFDGVLDHGPVKHSVSGRDLLGDPVGPGGYRGGVAAEAGEQHGQASLVQEVTAVAGEIEVQDREQFQELVLG